MAGVTIDIPNIGNIEAKNAATEATLKDILKVLQRTQRDIGNLEGGGGGDGGGDEGEGKKKTLGEKLGGAYGTLIGNTKNVAIGFGRVAMSAVDLIDDLAGVGDSLTSAATTLRHIPVVGGALAGLFGAVAGAAEGVAKSFNDAASSGATFGGSINEFSRSASAAGMTMAEFGSLIKSSGEGMLGFGTTVEAGAKRFSEVSRTLRTTSGDLYALGFSAQDINKGLATYGNMLRMQGLQGRQSNAQLVSGAQKYLKELDALAKITGVERAAKEAEMMATLKDAQFQGAMANQTKEVRDSFLATLGGLAGGMQGPLGNFAKDILATGTATTEENQKLLAMMPQSAALLQDLRAKQLRGEAVTAEERNRLNNLMAQEGSKAAKQMGGTFAAAPEFAGTMNALTLAQSMQKDALKDATDEQKKAAAETDKQNEAIQKSKQTLAEFSNSFQMALVNSGLLQGLMATFQTLATFVQSVIVPVFHMLSPVLTTAVQTISDLLTPAFNLLGGILQKTLMPAFYAISDFIEDNMVPVLAGAMVVIGPLLWSYVTALKAAVSAQYASIKAELAKMAALGPMLLLAAAVTAVVFVFKKFGGDMTVLGNGLKIMWEGFKTFLSMFKLGILKVLDFLPGVDFGDQIRETELEIAEQTKERERLATENAARMEANRKKGFEDQEKRDKARESRDKKFYADKTERDKKASTPETTALDMSSPEATAVSFFTQQKSPLVKAEATKKELENKKDEEAKKIALNPQAVAAEQAAAAAKTSNPELAEISKSMAELVKINKANSRIMERQLDVQESFSGDVWANPAA
jgi:hypothetical protein